MLMEVRGRVEEGGDAGYWMIDMEVMQQRNR